MHTWQRLRSQKGLWQRLHRPFWLCLRQTYPFDFSATEKPHESYHGLNVRLRYFIRVTVTRNFSGNSVKEQDFLVQKVEEAPEAVAPIKMEVGIEECLHIEFEYDKQKYASACLL